MKHVDVHTFKEVVEAEQSNETVSFINVCTPAEYSENHIAGVMNLPLDQLDARVNELAGKRTVYVHCRSGNRSQKAIEKLQQLGISAELVNVEGGILAWEEAGFKTDSFTTRLPIMRQVLIAAGVLVFLGYLLSLLVMPQFIYLSVFVSLGLIFAGVTGWCGMALVLSKMPWNK